MSWLSRFFGSRGEEPACFDVVNQYGASIERARRGVTGLMDINDLPFEKSAIKAAILEAAEHNRNDPAQIEILGAAFYMLGSFQAISTASSNKIDSRKLQSMAEEDFMCAIKEDSEARQADRGVQEQSLVEKVELMAEWRKHIQSLGICNA